MATRKSISDKYDKKFSESKVAKRMEMRGKVNELIRGSQMRRLAMGKVKAKAPTYSTKAGKEQVERHMRNG